jgi:putative ATP-binding cassette transporter
MLNTIPSLSRADVAMQKIEALGLSLSSHQSDIGASARSDENPAWTSLEMRGVTHHYTQEMEGSDFTLGPVDLALSPGELVFLIGGNGSGKTTLAKILTGLYSPETGVIRFNGENVTHDNRDLYRQNFSVIFADFYLFENLIGLDDQELDARASRYLAQLQLQHKVRVKDGALSTIDLSQGQRKRLALLTAYLEDRPIYVFDEWAADQDPLFREIFYFQVLPELIEKGKTVIVISHDDRYYHLAHRIIRLDYGKIEYDRYNTPAVDAVQQVALPSGK